MKGRIYDPNLGRFLQADPHVQAPLNSQNYNRYSYVLNNPMSYTDPSGYFFKSLFKGIKKYWRVLAAAAITYVTAGAAAGWAASWGFAAGTIANGAIAGAIAGAAGGFVATGSLKGALVGALSGAAFGAIGASFNAETGFLAKGGLGHIGSHAITGGIMADLQGGKFGHGFWSAGLTKALNVNGMIQNAGTLADVARIVTAAAIGGTVSKLTGGKFGNGAVSAGFGQAINGNSQRLGGKNNPMGTKTEGSISVEMPDGNYHYVDAETYYKNIGNEILAKQAGVVMSDYVTTTKEDLANGATVVATVSGVGGLALGSARLGYFALRAGGLSFLVDPSVDKAGWLVVDTATLRLGPVFHNTMFQGTDHAVGVFSWTSQTFGVGSSCQVPLKC